MKNILAKYGYYRHLSLSQKVELGFLPGEPLTPVEIAWLWSDDPGVREVLMSAIEDACEKGELESIRIPGGVFRRMDQHNTWTLFGRVYEIEPTAFKRWHRLTDQSPLSPDCRLLAWLGQEATADLGIDAAHELLPIIVRFWQRIGEEYKPTKDPNDIGVDVAWQILEEEAADYPGIELEYLGTSLFSGTFGNEKKTFVQTLLKTAMERKGFPVPNIRKLMKNIK
jgi:hypothetical protein